VIRTVDLVIAGGINPAFAAATDAVHRGRRVLIVLGADAGEWRPFRRDLRKAGNADGCQGPRTCSQRTGDNRGSEPQGISSSEIISLFLQRERL